MPPSEPGDSRPRLLTAPPAQRRGGRRRGHDAREFLPAALEVLETPANPIGRAVALVLGAFFVIALLWTMIGKVNIVAVAHGHVVPASGLKLIQPVATGTVRSINVQDGQHVRAGELLVALDPTASEADRDQLLRNRDEAGVDVARIKAFLAGLSGGDAVLKAPAGADPSLVAMYRARLEADLASFRAQLASYDATTAKQAAGEAALEAGRDKLVQTIPLIAEQEAALHELVDKGLTARPKWLNVKTQLIGARHDLTVAKDRIAEAKAAELASKRDRTKFIAETTRKAYADLINAQQRLEKATISLRTADDQARQDKLVAPVDGTVQQLAVHTVGGVVTPAQTLMVIVPDGDVLQVDSFVLNRDKGFVHPGEKAVVKFEAFPFTKYGTITGKVLSMSGDAIKDKQLGLVYDTRVSLSKTVIRADGQNVPIVPGMAVSVEIKTGQRRLIDYILSPLVRYSSDALRER